MKEQKKRNWIKYLLYLILAICIILWALARTTTIESTLFDNLDSDTIRFTWQGSADSSKSFDIRVTGQIFTVNWGDGSPIKTFKIHNSNDTSLSISHTYANTNNYAVTVSGTHCIFKQFRCEHEKLSILDVSDNKWLEFLHCANNQLTGFNLKENKVLYWLDCAHNKLTGLNLQRNRMLEHLQCHNNQLTELDLRINISELPKERQWSFRRDTIIEGQKAYYLSDTALLERRNLRLLTCAGNRLQLSDLYDISKTVSDSSIFLGTQLLVAKEILSGESVDFSTQKEFGGFPTVFTVEKDSSAAPKRDYAINDGIITFNATGNYTVTMTNEAIVSHKEHLAEVVIKINVM